MKQHLEKLTALIHKLPLHGALFSVVQKVLFVLVATLLGLWIALNFTLPTGMVLSLINKPLFEEDYGLNIESIGYFPLKTFSLEDGELTKKGETVITFSELSYTPSLWGMLSGSGSGDLSLENIGGEDNYLDASFSLGDFPCYDIEFEDISLTFLSRLSDDSDSSLRGEIDGSIGFCFVKGATPAKSKRKLRTPKKPSRAVEGDVSFALHDIVFKGKVPTPMGKLDVGRIPIGDIELTGVMDKKKLTIKKFSINGIFDITITGDISLNTRKFNESRLNLHVVMKIKDEKAIKKNNALTTVMSVLAQHKDRKNKQEYRFDVRGTVSSPTIQKARRTNTKKNRSLRNNRPSRKRKTPKRRK